MKFGNYKEQDKRTVVVVLGGLGTIKILQCYRLLNKRQDNVINNNGTEVKKQHTIYKSHIFVEVYKFNVVETV